jgi:hypothetical protein
MGNITFSILMTGTSDFFGLNFYTAFYGKKGEEGNIPSLGRDSGVLTTQDSNWVSSASNWLKVGTILRTCIAIKSIYASYNFLLYFQSTFLNFTKLNMFWEQLIAYFPSCDTGHIENDASNISSIDARVFVTAVTFLPSRCLATITGFLAIRCLETIGQFYRAVT